MYTCDLLVLVSNAHCTCCADSLAINLLLILYKLVTLTYHTHVNCSNISYRYYVTLFHWCLEEINSCTLFTARSANKWNNTQLLMKNHHVWSLNYYGAEGRLQIHTHTHTHIYIYILILFTFLKISETRFLIKKSNHLFVQSVSNWVRCLCIKIFLNEPRFCFLKRLTVP